MKNGICIRRGALSRERLDAILSTHSLEGTADLFAEARAARERHFGDRIFLYGFVYFSTWCGNDCNFCYYRKSNDIAQRYRKTPEEVIGLAKDLAGSGVHLIDLTMGEDALYHEAGFAPVLDIAQEIQKVTSLPVMLSPGVVGADVIDAAARTGITWFALYQETHNRALFAKLRHKQSYDARIRAKAQAAAASMLIEEGILTGVGESLGDIADSIEQMVNWAQARCV